MVPLMDGPHYLKGMQQIYMEGRLCWVQLPTQTRFIINKEQLAINEAENTKKRNFPKRNMTGTVRHYYTFIDLIKANIGSFIPFEEDNKEKLPATWISDLVKNVMLSYFLARTTADFNTDTSAFLKLY